MAETSPRFKTTLVTTFGVTLLLFTAAATSDSEQAPDPITPSTEAAASSSAKPVPASASPMASITPTAAPVQTPAPRPTAAPRIDEVTEAAGDPIALALLATIAVKGRSAKTGYERDLFGQAWSDVDRNGCDTRNDVLGRDLTAVTYKAGTRDCKVLGGTLAEPYTGRTLTFSSEDPMAVQIDHVVALSDAWQKGAAQWPAEKRLAFANDPVNLLAVDGPANGSKSDGDAATWLPPNKAYRCPMVARQVAVKARYGLWMTAAERDASARVLAACPTEAAPVSSAMSVAPGAEAPTAVAPPQPASSPPLPQPAAPPLDGVDPDYGTCRAAKAAGAGPYTSGQDPEYERYRDNDSDGMVCE